MLNRMSCVVNSVASVADSSTTLILNFFFPKPNLKLHSELRRHSSQTPKNHATSLPIQVPVYAQPEQLHSDKLWAVARKYAAAGDYKEFMKAYRAWHEVNRGRLIGYWQHSKDELLYHAENSQSNDPKIIRFLRKIGGPSYAKVVPATSNNNPRAF